MHFSCKLIKEHLWVALSSSVSPTAPHANRTNRFLQKTSDWENPRTAQTCPCCIYILLLCLWQGWDSNRHAYNLYFMNWYNMLSYFAKVFINVESILLYNNTCQSFNVLSKVIYLENRTHRPLSKMPDSTRKVRCFPGCRSYISTCGIIEIWNEIQVCPPWKS